jgi:hypothetical protein
MGANQFPVFGVDGLEGDLIGGGEPSADGLISLSSLPHDVVLTQPGVRVRNRCAEAERDAAESDRILALLKPKLAQALAIEKRRQAEVRLWTATVYSCEAEVSRLRNLVSRAAQSMEHADSQSGTRQERLRAAEARLAESRAELEAAQEELATATAAAEALTEAEV